MTAVVAAALGGIAYAQVLNSYSVTGSTTPATTGSTQRPVAVGVRFGYRVAEQQGRRPAVVERYSIRFNGLRVNTNAFPGCTAARINAAGQDDDCPSGARIGTGTVQAVVGATADPNDRSLSCALRLSVYNARRNRAALFLSGGPNQTPSCPIELAVAIDARFVRRGSAIALEFTVPQSLRHPLPTLANAVVSVQSTITRRTRRVRGRTVGFFEAAGGCRNGRRTIAVVFAPEQGDPTRTSTTASCR